MDGFDHCAATEITGSSVHKCPVDYEDIQLQPMRIASDVSGFRAILKVICLPVG